MDRRHADELGAHVSAEGGVQNAPARAREIQATCLQLFTKQPSRWAEPIVDGAVAAAFREARETHGIRVAGAHDSYLINLSSPDRALWDRSLACFAGELTRCGRLGLDFLVTHPGNATDGDVPAGIRRNAEGIARALEEVGEGPTRVLLELTAGSGTSVGGSFENLAAILDAIPGAVRGRVGVCVDTCHAYAAGYDLVGDYDATWEAYEGVLPWDALGLLHLNDSKHPLGSHKDRHETLGEGTLGPEPFRRIMTDERLRLVPKILETPKGDDPVAADLANLGFLRAFRDR
ncbi:MAG TPA: deoxyribonuclease IV [Longimicrobiales bacterium]|nr:deoxyribonuclease IV [Longimicrobiales bacterium]